MTATSDERSQVAVDPANATRDVPTTRQIVTQSVGAALLVAIVAIRFGWRAAAVVAAVAYTLIAIGSLSTRASAVADLVDRVARWVATGVGAGLLTGLWALVSLIPWLLQRPIRWDPTWAPRPRGSRWVELVDADGRPARMWTADRRSVRASPGRRAHRAVAVAGCVALLGATAGAWGWYDQRQRDHLRYSVPALEDQPWWPGISDAVDMAFGRSTLSSFVGGVVFRDVEFPDFNVTDGRRHSWTPPAGTCEPVDVWAFGGSTMFGLGQRDDHTIPSELAREAWRDGVPVRVHNWGVPADTFWMETRRLELALAEGHDPPALVIFYDGVNDFRVQANMNGHGRGGALSFPNDMDATALEDIRRRNERLAFLMALARDAPVVAPEPHSDLTPEEVATRGAHAYAEAARLIAPLLESRNISWVQFYQPSRATRSAPLASERAPDGSDDTYWRPIERVFRSNLSPHVIDLSGAMEATRVPVYYDELHTNEVGARVVGRAIYAHVSDQLRASSVQRNGTRACR